MVVRNCHDTLQLTSLLRKQRHAEHILWPPTFCDATGKLFLADWQALPCWL
jgi:hypothetical protein